MNPEYWRGRNNEPFSGGNYQEWQRGQRDGGYGGQPDIGCVVAGLLIVIGIPLFGAVVVACIAALLFSLVVILIWKYKRGEYKFKGLFMTGFWSAFTYVLLIVIAIILTLSLTVAGIINDDSIINLLFRAVVFSSPFIFLIALIPYKRYKSRGWRPKGYWNAVLITTFIIVPLVSFLIALSGYLYFQYSDDHTRELLRSIWMSTDSMQ